MKNKIKEIFNILPIIAALGILAGFGAYQTIFGALLCSVIFINKPKIFAPSIIYVIALSGLNIYLGGKSGSLFALIFISYFIFIIYSVLKWRFFPKSELKKNEIINAFIYGIIFCCIILCFPLLIGKTAFSSFNLMLFSLFDIFGEINEFAVVCSLLVLAVYYYCSKVKYLPAIFISVIAGCIANYLYKMDLPNLNMGYENFIFPAQADFGHFPLLLIFGTILTLIIIFELKAYPKYKIQTGISGILSSIAGFIPSMPQKTISKYEQILFLVILIIFSVFFTKIASFIPICTVAMALAIKCFEILKLKLKHIHFNKTFIFCFIATVYNVALGAIICIISIFFIKFLPKRKV